MRLLRLHVANFGKINDLTVDFSRGCNVFARENGWGKTTLTRFIKVMFYGFEGERSKALKDRERNRYMPWQGGLYGGEIIFEADGRTYMMRREFGKKPAEDSYILYNTDTMMAVDDFGADVGEELFHMDAEAFMNTIYIGENDCNMEITGGISAAMNNRNQNNNVTEKNIPGVWDEAAIGSADDISSLNGLVDRDVAGYDAADKRLKDAINKLSPTRATGMLYKKKQEITAMEAELRQLADVEAKLDATEERVDMLGSRLADTERAYAVALKSDVDKSGRSPRQSYKKDSVYSRNGINDNGYRRSEESDSGNNDGLESRGTVIMWLLAVLMLIVGSILIVIGKALGVAMLAVGVVLVLIIVCHRKSSIYNNNEDDGDEKYPQMEHNYHEIGEYGDLAGTGQYDEPAAEYRKKAEALRNEIFEGKTTLLKLREKKTELDRLSGKLEMLTEDYKKGLHKYKLLKECRTSLKEAREKYTLSYSTPLLEAFIKYMDMFDDYYKQKLNGTFIIDGENNISLMSDGAKRNIESLSRGYRDMTGLAARLGCIDVMCGEEKPFIIMDDPFAGFDDEHVKLGLELLKTLEEQYQILYFTCSSART